MLELRRLDAVRTFAVVMFAAMWWLMIPVASQAAPDSKLWEHWTAHDPDSTTSVDHGKWDEFLIKYLFPGEDKIFRMAYGEVSERYRKTLDSYIAALAAVTVSELNRPEQKAYWINLYNALTVRSVLDAYPVTSIRDIDISPGLFADGPWGKPLVVVEDLEVSLDDIEHRILRPIWKDPRIHYAVNCAAIGCPNLSWHAYTARKMERQLGEAARAYINHPRGARRDGGRLVVSSLFDWYAEDFGGSEAGVLRHLAQYADAPLASAIADGVSIGGYEYDWALNSVAPVVADRLRKRGS